MTIRSAVLTVLWLFGCAVAHAGDATLTIPSFKSLEKTATDSVNINLGPWLLHMAGSFLDPNDANDLATQRILAGIKSIQVRSFEFATDFAYPTADIDGIRRQLSSPGWTRLIQAHNRKSNEDLDIYIAMENDQTKGFTLIASEPRQFTVINIVGSIGVKDLPALEEHLHIPRVNFLPMAKL